MIARFHTREAVPVTREELIAFVRAFLSLEPETVLWARAESIIRRADSPPGN